MKNDEPKPDPRHAPIRELIRKLYAQANSGLAVPWTGRHAKVLADLLHSLPSWPVEVWLRCVRNRFASEGINSAQDPIAWINRLVDFAAGPLNRFGEPLVTKTQSRRAEDAIADYWEWRRKQAEIAALGREPQGEN